MRYNHAYSFGFEVISDNEDGTDVTGAQLRAAMIAKLAKSTDQDITECCDCPWDTFEIDE